MNNGLTSDNHTKISCLIVKRLLAFCRKSKLERVVVTTRTIQAEKDVDGIPVEFIPASVYCYLVGQNRIQSQAARKG